ncbi:hypothetical protein D0C36_18280 [Mucilaginibacter conchicola]|uniref:Uncharacterized protein n=1 Tax=Mucilaginibacter conchicola TaxID=2303333 RepID=A0A372NPN2_9SPHI|nr:hypothetical protein [Mucilaginibacter conchicola]RFZ90899.1 hypothetical protein D0C36_18280 [Mucilaginibacter conchicola]
MKQSIVQRKKDEKKRRENIIKWFRIAFGLFSTLNFFLIFGVFRPVFMDYTMSVLFGIFLGIAVALFAKRNDGKLVMFLAGASFAFSIPLFINNAFASSEVITEKVLILNKHRRFGKSAASVDIEYAGYQKNVLTNDEKMGRSTHLIIKVRKGALGYYILEDSEVADN